MVAGWLRVPPEERDASVRHCHDVVRQALAAPGCLDFWIDADAADPASIRVYERWRDEPSLLEFRGSGSSGEGGIPVLEADVRQYEISAEHPA